MTRSGEMKEYELTVHMICGSSIEVNIDSELDLEELSNDYGKMYLENKDGVINMKEKGPVDLAYVIPIKNISYYKINKAKHKENEDD